MSLIQQVAEWVHARSEGAISAEVAAEFALTVSKASIAIGQIHRESRFTTRVVAQDPSRWHLRGSGGSVR